MVYQIFQFERYLLAKNNLDIVPCHHVPWELHGVLNLISFMAIIDTRLIIGHYFSVYTFLTVKSASAIAAVVSTVSAYYHWAT